MPRVIAGKFKGRTLDAPKGDNTRPTGDKAKEALFSIIQTRVPGCVFADVFAGTGSVGIEALSRGADSVVLVEKAGQACGVIKSNLRKLGIDQSEQIELMKMSFDAALAKFAEDQRKFDVIFMDPPYRMAQKAAETATAVIMEHDLLNEDGILIVEHSSDLPFVTDVMNMKPIRSCRYGLAVLTFFSKS
ncbi:MAG: 16S rRNA (guanine(966)-N(2))-methyltransferase RsmD [Clostridiales bacterium]|nr:16S rRNA (guanine(966)-N(2))-methyltransferase RsmD [Clostridiales bacterium]